MLPTFANLAKAELPKLKIDGKDIWPLMAGKENAKSPHDNFFYYRGSGLRAVRSGKWKLHINNNKKGKKGKQHELTLYNLSKDISEKNDIAAKNKNLVNRLYKVAQAFDLELKKNARTAGTVNKKLNQQIQKLNNQPK